MMFCRELLPIDFATTDCGNRHIIQSRKCNRQALRALDSTHKPGTIARAARMRQLERQMTHMQPGERAVAIRERMRIGRSTYYNLRKL